MGTANAILTSSDNTITLPAGYYEETTISTNIQNLPGTISYTYHTHTDSNGAEYPDGYVIYSKTNPGGCFGASGHIHNKTGTCGTKTTYCDGILVTTDYTDNQYHYTVAQCPKCGARGAAGSTGGGVCGRASTSYTCGNYTNVWKLSCGKTTSTIESATIVY